MLLLAPFAFPDLVFLVFGGTYDQGILTLPGFLLPSPTHCLLYLASPVQAQGFYCPYLALSLDHLYLVTSDWWGTVLSVGPFPYDAISGFLWIWDAGSLSQW